MKPMPAKILSHRRNFQHGQLGEIHPWRYLGCYTTAIGSEPRDSESVKDLGTRDPVIGVKMKIVVVEEWRADFTFAFVEEWRA